MFEVNIPTMIGLVQHVGFRQRQPLMFWGPPGAGKSEGVRSAVEELLNSTGVVYSGSNYHANGCDRLVDVRLSQYDSVDLRGIPVPDADEELTVWHAPSTMPFKDNPRFKDDGTPIVLFLDEINSAAPAVAAVAYQLVNDRRVGEHELNDNVVVLAAGNREQDRGVVNRMPTPLANRFTHAEIAVDHNAWCFWAQKANMPPVGIAFIQFRPNLLSTFDPAKPDKAFGTPRTWVKALRYWDDASMPDDIKQAAIAGAVGKGNASEFLAYCEIWQKVPKISDIEKGPNKVPVPEEAGMRYAVAVSISGAMTAMNIAPLCKYLSRMDPEFGVLAWKLALQRDRSLSGTDEFLQWSEDFGSLFG